jgi:hypothetical protein
VARNFVVERIEGPIGQGTAEKAVRVVGASDDPATARGLTVESLTKMLLVEQRITNLLLAQAFGQNDGLEKLRSAILQEI